MDEKKIRIGITQGDTNGVGYELIFKIFAEPELLELCTPVIYGSPKIATYHRKALEMEVNFSIIHHADEVRTDRLNLLATTEEEVKVELGTPSEESGKAARNALDRALADCKEGLIDVLVNAPINESTFFAKDETNKDLVEYIAQKLGAEKEPEILSVNDQLHVATVAGETAIKNVAKEITKENIVAKATLMHETLKRDFRISIPRIAVLALNPETSEGQLGKEEQEAIVPAIKEMVADGLTVFGPYQADTFFGGREYDAFDGVLAMYYDQGITPFKALSVEGGVRLLAGLPVVVASSDHEVGYDRAGQGLTDEQAFRHALYLAMDVFRNRLSYDRPFANPLKKLYHEKRDESEKVRFSVNKKRGTDGEKKSS